jgi:hypothetical protein
MDTKLSGRVAKHLLAYANGYAQAHKTTLTALITVYLQQIPNEFVHKTRKCRVGSKRSIFSSPRSGYNSKYMMMILTCGNDNRFKLEF